MEKQKIYACLALLLFAARSSINIIFLNESENTFTLYDTDISPVGSPLLECRAFFSLTYSLILILYCVASTFSERHVSNITSSNFYKAFILFCVFETIHTLLWALGKTVLGLIFICLASFCQYVALYFAYTGLYYAKSRDSDLEASKIWCNRVFVQSGLIFDCAWNSVMVLLTLAVVLCYNVGLTSFHASCVALVVYSAALIIWFGIENFVVEKFVRFTVAEYIAVSIALTSLLSRDRSSATYFPILLLSLMAMVLIMLFVRVFVIVCMETRRKNQERLYMMVAL